jgi:hypothetical protein
MIPHRLGAASAVTRDGLGGATICLSVIKGAPAVGGIPSGSGFTVRPHPFLVDRRACFREKELTDRRLKEGE